jgi:hypothetical protein
MPEGYKCDKCETFSEYTHNSTTIDFGTVALQDKVSAGPKEIVLCPECATEVRSNIKNVSIPKAVLDDL